MRGIDPCKDQYIDKDFGHEKDVFISAALVVAILPQYWLKLGHISLPVHCQPTNRPITMIQFDVK